MRKRKTNKVRQYLLVLAVFFIFTLVWQCAVTALDVPNYILPPPTEVGKKLIALPSTYFFWNDVTTTVREAFYGYAISIFIAVVLGGLISQFYILELSLMPYIVAFQTIPSIALAPIYLVWFGYGITAKIAMAVTIACFPIMINVIAGLQSTNVDQIQMLRAFGASRFQVFYKVSIPNALPHFFTGLKLGVIMSLTGALVAEFVGAKAGLGFRTMQFYEQLKIADMFGVLAVLGLIGVLAHALISYLRRKVVFWERGDEG